MKSPHLDDPARTQRCDIDASGRMAGVTEFGDLSRWHIPGYELIEQIGQGGFGRVFKARQDKLARLVAVKLIEPADTADQVEAERFQAEAMAVARLRHENVVVAHDFGQAGDRLYLVMELLDGEDLAHRIQERGPLDEQATWYVIRQAAAGLAHAAACGLVHRDVKPANLFLTATPPTAALPPGIPLVKVTDFGLATTTDPADGPRKGVEWTIGTPSYMAPEQARGEAVDHRADIYSLGATAYHALTGRPPFEGRTLRDVMAKKADHTPAPLPTTSATRLNSFTR